MTKEDFNKAVAHELVMKGKESDEDVCDGCDQLTEECRCPDRCNEDNPAQDR